MPYASEADITEAYGAAALRDRAPLTGAGEPDPAAITRALAEASALMDASIGVRYALPLAEAPPVLRQVCVDLALAQLALSAAAMTEELARRRTERLRWLEQVAQGRVSLGATEEPPRTGGAPQVHSAPRRFTRGTMRGL